MSSPFSDKSNRVGHPGSDKSSLFNEAEVEAEAASATTANYPPPHTASVVNDTTKPWDQEGTHMLQAAMALAKAACQLHAPEVLLPSHTQVRAPEHTRWGSDGDTCCKRL